MPLNAAADDASIRQLLAARVRAIQDKDVDAVAAHYDPDAVLYNLAPPLQKRGVNPRELREWFGSYDGPIGYEVDDEEIFVDGGVAFCHFLYHVTGKQTSGGEVDMWVRATLGLLRRDGEWKIVHGHDSDPFDMQTFQALLNLKP